MTNTVSLPLSKELWELELKIETEKWWIIYDREWECVYIKYHEELADVNNYYPAYSTDELLVVLPYKINKIDYLVIRKAFTGYYVQYWDYESKEMIGKMNNKSLPEALGLMCKYLLTNGYEFNGKEIVRKGEK